jgi:polyferredoxin
MELATKLRSALITSKNGTLTPRDIPLGMRRPTKGLWKFNLLKLGAIKRLLLSPLYPAALQAACVPLFLIALLLLFFGPNNPQANPAAVLSWALGWPLLIFGAFFVGRAWCSICPIGAMAETVRRIICLDRPFPQFLKQNSDFLVAGAILAIMWFESATDIRNSPLNLGFLLLAMLISAVIVNAVYEKESWCLYLCGLGGIVGAVAKTSFIELRADRNICIARCDTNDCLSGTSEVEGCPYGQAGPKLLSNRLCKLCARCIKNCPHDAFSLNLRIPGSEIWEAMHANPGTAFLVVGMVGGLFCEMISHTDMFHQIVATLAMPKIVVFTCLFLSVTLVSNIMLVSTSAFSRLVVEQDFIRNYARFGLALLPLAVMGFMAYHIYYLLNVGESISSFAQQYTQARIFMSFDIKPGESLLYGIQVGLIVAGVVWSALLMCFVARSVSESFGRACLGVLPHVILAILFAVALVFAIQASFYGA